MSSQNNRFSFKLNPDFSRLLKVLNHQIPDRVPIAEMCVDKSIKEKFLGREIKKISDEVDFWHKAGYDYAWIRAGYGIDELFIGAYESGTGHAAPPIKTVEDFENYPWKNFDDIDYSILDDAATCLPDGMGIISGEGGFFSFSWMLMGMDTFCLHCMDEDGLAAAIIKKVGDTLIEVNSKAVAHPAVGAIWIGDDLAYGTGLMMSPDWYRQHIFPYYIELGKICRQHGKPLIFHSDGDIRLLINDLIDAGVSTIHPIEPQAMNIEEIKRDYGNKLALIGNIDLIHTLPHGTIEEIREEVTQRIELIGKNGGYCVGSANSVTSNIPLENYIAMIEAVYEYGKY